VAKNRKLALWQEINSFAVLYASSVQVSIKDACVFFAKLLILCFFAIQRKHMQAFQVPQLLAHKHIL